MPLIQEFCQKAKLSNSPRFEKAGDEKDEILMINNTRVIVREVSTPSMEHMDPFKSPFVVINAKVGVLFTVNGIRYPTIIPSVYFLQGLSNAELSHVITCVTNLNSQDHTILILGEFKLAEMESLCKLAQEASRGWAIPFTICTTQNGWQEGNEVHCVVKYILPQPLEHNSHIFVTLSKN